MDKMSCSKSPALCCHSYIVLLAGCDASCATCSGSRRNQCTSCFTGWWLFNGYTGNYCKNCNSNADCPVSNSYCGCGLPDNVCYYCDTSCAACSSSGSSSCTKCYPGFVLQSKYANVVDPMITSESLCSTCRQMPSLAHCCPV